MIIFLHFNRNISNGSSLIQFMLTKQDSIEPLCVLNNHIVSINLSHSVKELPFGGSFAIHTYFYLSSRRPFQTGWRIPPLCVSCMKCAVPTSSGFSQTAFLYFANHGFETRLFFANASMIRRSSLEMPRYTLPRHCRFPSSSK